MCSDTQNCLHNFDAYKIDYEFVDICASLPNLKAFLQLRETPVYEQVKANGGIGIPALVKEDGTATLDYEGYLKELGKEVLSSGEACSL